MTMRRVVPYLVAPVALLLLAIAAVFAMQASAGTAPSATDVRVPVIFDRVLYGPEEFNAKQRELAGRVTLRFAVKAGDHRLYAFSTLDGLNLWRAALGSGPLKIPAPTEKGQKGGGEPFLIPASSSSHDAGASRRGLLSPLFQICNPPLSTHSVNYEHENCGGAGLGLPNGSTISDLRDPCPGCGNWNDRVSSLTVSTGADWETVFQDIFFGALRSRSRVA